MNPAHSSIDRNARTACNKMGGMKKRIALVIASLLFLPGMASAHATPVSTTPEMSSQVQEAPKEISIRFSERIDSGASTLVVRDPAGASAASAVHVDPQDPRTLIAAMHASSTGAYTVTWSVVSSDDGHFTRGSYAFVVGTGALPSGMAETEIVQITTMPEALAMTLELYGNGLIWAVLILWAFAARRVLAPDNDGATPRAVRRLFTSVFWIGGVSAIVGAAAQIAIKTSDLATLQAKSFADTLSLYLHTEAGLFTLLRLCTIVVVAIIYTISVRSISKSKKITVSEITLFAVMCVFALLRAVISHATANPFYPYISVAINFVHLIEKDFWAGALTILLIMSLSKQLRAVLAQMLQRAFELLSYNFAFVVVTATYIVWLHLKSFENLLSTQWGTAFLQLFIVAICVVLLRVYHVGARVYTKRFFEKALTYTLAAECAVAILVVYFSSVVIITSPPLPLHSGPIYSARDQSVHITLSADPYEDDMALLTIDRKDTQTPDVTIEGTGGAIAVELSKRFDGGYVFPRALLSTNQHVVDISVAQKDAYDAHARFEVPASPFDTTAVPAHGGRSFDTFTASMIGIAIAGIVLAAALWYLSRQKTVVHLAHMRGAFPELSTAVIFLTVIFFLGTSVSAFASSRFANPFKAACENDGNMWHLMQPTKAGIARSSTPREGCMWGMGDKLYMFADQREYEYLSNLPKADVALAFENSTLVAGREESFTVSITNPDGTPAHLLWDMEKLAHVVIVSADERHFAHIHADDARALTNDEIQSSSFRFSHIFPESGEYLISVDYANGTRLETKQFTVKVAGSPSQQNAIALYPSPAKFSGYDVSIQYDLPRAGEVTTLRWRISKNGSPVQLQQYLAAAAHISVVKNDLSAFIHIHGEVHIPGTPLPEIRVKNGQVVHSMAMMTVPTSFTSPVEAHLIFPSAGLYTVWAEFNVGGTIVPTAFSVRVEE